MTYSKSDLDAALERQKAIEERWANYSGNNPDKYESERRAARREVAIITEALKASGVVERTPQEELEARLDCAFPDASSKEVVEFEGIRYRRRFMPAEKSRSGKTVTRWSAWWERVKE